MIVIMGINYVFLFDLLFVNLILITSSIFINDEIEKNYLTKHGDII